MSLRADLRVYDACGDRCRLVTIRIVRALKAVTLVYRSVFTDADGRISAQVPAAFANWLRSKGLVPPDGGMGLSGGALESLNGSIAWAARSSFVASDRKIQRVRLVEETNDDRWVTTLSWDGAESDEGSGSGWLWVDLEHEPNSGHPLVRPGSPRLVRELLAAGEAVDGGVPLTSEVWQVRSGQVSELLRFVTSTTRQIPIIVFAHDVQRAYNQVKLASQLARDLAGVAAVFRLADGHATERFSQLMPEGFAVYGGAMRTYLPGAGAADDNPSRHRVLGRASLTALGLRAFPAVKDQILEASVRRGTPLSLSVRQKSGETDRARSRPPRESTDTDVGATLSIPRDWLSDRIRRIRRSLGKSELAEQSPTQQWASFDSALDELIAVDRTPSDDEKQLDTNLTVRTLAEVGAERELLSELLDAAQVELDQAAAQLKVLESELDALQVEATEAAEAMDRAERRGRWLSKRLYLAADEDLSAEDELPPAPPSVAEVLVLAREHLAWLSIGKTDESAAELDLHGSSQLYAIKAWAGLIALNAYTQARSEGRFYNSFYAWCQEPPPGEPAISAAAVALVESETVATNPALRRTRLFPVPTTLDDSGYLYMPAHIKVVKRGWPCPRLHFHDDTGRSGKIYVGYLGEHLRPHDLHKNCPSAGRTSLMTG